MVNEDRLMETIKEHRGLTWFIAMGADKFVSAPIGGLNNVDVKNLYELRAFNGMKEVKAVRGNLGDVFDIRDTDCYNLDSKIMAIKECHYLDINRKQNVLAENGYFIVNAAAGGIFGIPFAKCERLRLKIIMLRTAKVFTARLTSD